MHHYLGGWAYKMRLKKSLSASVSQAERLSVIAIAVFLGFVKRNG